MSGSYKVTGADELAKVARRLKDAGETELRKEMLRGIRTAAKPVVPDIKASARDRLPKAGNLNDVIARSKIGVRTRLAGEKVGVRIRGVGRHNLVALQYGRVRKPLFGNRAHWFEQQVEPGFFDDPIEKRQDDLRRGLERVITETARKMER